MARWQWPGTCPLPLGMYIISHMAKQIDRPIEEAKREIYICHAYISGTWTQLEVIDTWDPENGSKCHWCSSALALRNQRGHTSQVKCRSYRVFPKIAFTNIGVSMDSSSSIMAPFFANQSYGKRCSLSMLPGQRIFSPLSISRGNQCSLSDTEYGSRLPRTIYRCGCFSDLDSSSEDYRARGLAG